MPLRPTILSCNKVPFRLTHRFRQTLNFPTQVDIPPAPIGRGPTASLQFQDVCSWGNTQRGYTLLWREYEMCANRIFASNPALLLDDAGAIYLYFVSYS